MRFGDLKTLIESRRTTKDLEECAISRADIDALLHLFIQAPNHRLNQPWRFRIISKSGIFKLIDFFTTKAAPEEFNIFVKNFERLTKVASVIYVTSIKDANELIDLENYAACSAGVQNLLLGATSLGLQSYWNTGRLMTHPITTEFLKMEPNERMVGAIWLGKGTPPPAKERTPAAAKTVWID